jgi:hypothetical protein
MLRELIREMCMVVMTQTDHASENRCAHVGTFFEYFLFDVSRFDQLTIWQQQSILTLFNKREC